MSGHEKTPRWANSRGTTEGKFRMTNDTNTRDELLRLHAPLTTSAQEQPEYRDNTESALYGYSEGVEHALDTVWAKGYRKPRTITTIEELAGLPDGSVVLDGIGRAFQRWTLAGWQKAGPAIAAHNPRLPATVLYQPGPLCERGGCPGRHQSRAEKATRWQQEYDQTKSDTAAIMTVHAAGQSSADVPRLLAALEAAIAKADELIESNTGAPGPTAFGLKVAARQIQSAIEEALS